VTPVLLDTGVIVALLDRSERHHAKCVTVVGGLERVMVTCEAVIAESCQAICPATILSRLEMHPAAYARMRAKS
jgi:predicted nucleic acid-binding protein